MQKTKFQKEYDAWFETVTAEKRHTQLGINLYSKGLALLESIPIKKNKIEVSGATAKELNQLTANARAMISEGIKMESIANHNLIKLAETEPERNIL